MAKILIKSKENHKVQFPKLGVFADQKSTRSFTREKFIRNLAKSLKKILNKSQGLSSKKC